MTLELSSVAQAPEARHGNEFSARRLDLGALDGYVAPIVGFDHFRMRGPTFAPHPHAGFSAVSYLFEDSEGAMHNRDSLGHDLIAGPGDVIWTQAASGVMHEEVPAQIGVPVHGLQLFVNLSARNKHIAPAAFHADSASLPIVKDQQGNRIKIVSGGLGSDQSPISLAEDFDLLDVTLEGLFSYDVRQGWNALIYVLSGTATVSTEGQQRTISVSEAVGARSVRDGGRLAVEPHGDAHILLLSGQDAKEPVAIYGPFIMNSKEELSDAYDRYRKGDMGWLD